MAMVKPGATMCGSPMSLLLGCTLIRAGYNATLMSSSFKQGSLKPQGKFNRLCEIYFGV